MYHYYDLTRQTNKLISHIEKQSIESKSDQLLAEWHRIKR